MYILNFKGSKHASFYSIKIKSTNRACFIYSAMSNVKNVRSGKIAQKCKSRVFFQGFKNTMLKCAFFWKNLLINHHILLTTNVGQGIHLLVKMTQVWITQVIL